MSWWAVGAAVVGAAGSVIGGNKAASASAAGSKAAIEEQRRQFDIAMGLQKPWAVTGTGAENALAKLYGLPYSPYQDPQASSGYGQPPRTGTTSSGSPWGAALGSGAGFALGGVGGSILGGVLGFGGGYHVPKGTINTDKVIALLKSGMKPEDIAKLYPMSSRFPSHSIKKLTALGLTADQINMLYGGPAGLAQGAQQAANPNMVNGVVTPSGPDMSGFFNSPGYNFRKQEGMSNLGNSFAARGGAFSGNALRGLTDFNQNLASEDYYNFVNQLNNMAGRGQTAVTNTGQFGMQAGTNIGNFLQNQGDARASGIAAGYGGAGNALGGLAQYWGQNPPSWG